MSSGIPGNVTVFSRPSPPRNNRTLMARQPTYERGKRKRDIIYEFFFCDAVLEICGEEEEGVGFFGVMHGLRPWNEEGGREVIRPPLISLFPTYVQPIDNLSTGKCNLFTGEGGKHKMGFSAHFIFSGKRVCLFVL